MAGTPVSFRPAARPLPLLPVMLIVACSLGFGSAGDIAGQEPRPRFEPGECVFESGDLFDSLIYECGWLVLPESRERPSERIVRLAVAIWRAPEPNGDPPLVVLHGGPGGSRGQATLGTGMQAGFSNLPVARERDVVFYDQRAAGYSEPQLCPEQIADIVAERVSLGRGLDECAASLRASGMDRASYSTRNYAHDLKDLRLALGYTRWDVYGQSHGGRLALEAMRVDPAGTRSVVLFHPGVPGDDPNNRPLYVQRAFARLFAACDADVACGGAFSPAEDLDSLFAELERSPFRLRGESPAGESVVMDGQEFLGHMRRLIESQPLIGHIPFLLHELRHGDREEATRFILSNQGARFGGGARDQPSISAQLVRCHGSYAPDVEARAAAITAELAPPFRQWATPWGASCPTWQDRFASADERAPVTSDIPALVITGELDIRTPPEYGPHLASSLSRSRVIELAGTGHLVRPTDCELEIIVAFLRDPDREPDTACVARMPRIRFVTTWSDTLRKGS